jgi:hypothetical protein
LYRRTARLEKYFCGHRGELPKSPEVPKITETIESRGTGNLITSASSVPLRFKGFAVVLFGSDSAGDILRP